MSNWDIFQAQTLELQRGLSTRHVQAALAAGELHEDDLARPAGSSERWLHISQIAELMEPGQSPSTPLPSLAAPIPESPASSIGHTDFELDSIEPTSSSLSWPESTKESENVSFPVLSDLDEVGESASLAAENVPREEKSDQFRFSPEPSSEHSPAQLNWIWKEIDEAEDDDGDDDDIPAPESRSTVNRSGGPPAPCIATPAKPAEHLELSIYDLDSNLGEDSSSRIAVPVPLDRSSVVALPVMPERSSQMTLSAVESREWNEASIVSGDDTESDDEQPFTFARRSANKVEELDLAPMVDVAFQLVLFFMVTATTVLYKTLEVPKPSGENPPGAITQEKTQSVDDLRDDFIVIEIDSAGAFKIDRESVVADMDTLVERLRTARDKTARLTMLLSADFATPHRFAVLAIDAANEIGLRIAVARPQGRQVQVPAPSIFPISPARSPQAKEADRGI